MSDGRKSLVLCVCILVTVSMVCSTLWSEFVSMSTVLQGSQILPCKTVMNNSLPFLEDERLQPRIDALSSVGLFDRPNESKVFTTYRHIANLNRSNSLLFSASAPNSQERQVDARSYGQYGGNKSSKDNSKGPVFQQKHAKISKVDNQNSSWHRSSLACIGIFGVIGRSIRLVWHSYLDHIIQPLEKAGYRVMIYGYEIQIGSNLVDGTRIDENASSIVPFDILESELQDKIDVKIRRNCQNISCSLRYDHEPCCRHLTQNAHRQMFAENKVAHFFQQHAEHCNVGIGMTSDLLYLDHLNISDVKASTTQSDTIYTVPWNEGEGFTNGFYMGAPLSVAKVMSRFDNYAKYSNLKRDYERTVKAAFELYRLKRGITKIPFCKVRANGARWAGVSLPKKYVRACLSAELG